MRYGISRTGSVMIVLRAVIVALIACTAAVQAQLYPASETIAISHWPKIPDFVFAGTETFSAPAVSDWYDGRVVSLPESSERPRLERQRRLARGAVPLPQQAPWPRLSPPQAFSATITLPVPDPNIFEIQGKSNAATQPAVVPSAHHAEPTQPPIGNEANAVKCAPSCFPASTNG
jgi:hypothetical protein